MTMHAVHLLNQFWEMERQGPHHIQRMTDFSEQVSSAPRPNLVPLQTDERRVESSVSPLGPRGEGSLRDRVLIPLTLTCVCVPVMCVALCSEASIGMWQGMALVPGREKINLLLKGILSDSI